MAKDGGAGQLIEATHDAWKSRSHKQPVAIEKLFDRLPPHSIEAEMALFGSMIL